MGQSNISADSFRVQIPTQKMNCTVVKSPGGSTNTTPQVVFANMTQQSRVAGTQVKALFPQIEKLFCSVLFSANSLNSGGAGQSHCLHSSKYTFRVHYIDVFLCLGAFHKTFSCLGHSESEPFNPSVRSVWPMCHRPIRWTVDPNRPTERAG